MNRHEKMFKKLYRHNPVVYKNKIVEELAEFQLAAIHHFDNKETPLALIEEAADVFIQIQKVLALYPTMYTEFRKKYDENIQNLTRISENG